MILKSRRGQSTLEFAALIAVVVAAIVAINLYMRRGIEGHLRSASDDIGTNYDNETGGYRYINELQATEITHSQMGSEGGDLNIGIGIEQGVTTDRGREAQWTQQSASREMDEATATDADAIIGGGAVN